jgi:hypothetical protein
VRIALARPSELGETIPMAAEIIVVGRSPLPREKRLLKRFKPLSFTLESEDGGAEVWDDDRNPTREWLHDRCKWLDFEPRSIVRIRKAWDNAFSAAYELARILDGIVTDDHSLEAHYDGHAEASPVDDRKQLEQDMWSAFSDPTSYLERMDDVDEGPASPPDPDREPWVDAVVERLERARNELVAAFPKLADCEPEVAQKSGTHGPRTVSLSDDDITMWIKVGTHDGTFREKPFAETGAAWVDVFSRAVDGQAWSLRCDGGFLAELGTDELSKREVAKFVQIAQAAANDCLTLMAARTSPA